MKIKAIISEDIFLPVALLPILLSAILILSNVKAPSELFKFEAKKQKAKSIKKIKVLESPPKEEPVKVEAIKSLSSALLAPTNVGSDLKSLSAGVVSESSSGAGGMNISQGDVSSNQLVKETGGENKAARATQVNNPIYPQSARARGIEGYVVLELSISERGTILEVRVLQSKPEGVFDQVAIEAVKKWTFTPAIKDGNTVTSKIKQKVNFELDE